MTEKQVAHRGSAFANQLTRDRICEKELQSMINQINGEAI